MGSDIRAGILPAIQALQAEKAELVEALEALADEYECHDKNPHCGLPHNYHVGQTASNLLAKHRKEA